MVRVLYIFLFWLKGPAQRWPPIQPFPGLTRQNTTRGNTTLLWLSGDFIKRWFLHRYRPWIHPYPWVQSSEAWQIPRETTYPDIFSRAAKFHHRRNTNRSCSWPSLGVYLRGSAITDAVIIDRCISILALGSGVRKSRPGDRCFNGFDDSQWFFSCISSCFDPPVRRSLTPEARSENMCIKKGVNAQLRHACEAPIRSIRSSFEWMSAV